MRGSKAVSLALQWKHTPPNIQLSGFGVRASHAIEVIPDFAGAPRSRPTRGRMHRSCWWATSVTWTPREWSPSNVDDSSLTSSASTSSLCFSLLIFNFCFCRLGILRDFCQGEHQRESGVREVGRDYLQQNGRKPGQGTVDLIYPQIQTRPTEFFVGPNRRTAERPKTRCADEHSEAGRIPVQLLDLCSISPLGP